MRKMLIESKAYRLWLVGVLILLDCAVCWGQKPRDGQGNYYFRSLQVEDGLSQSSVYTIFQDRQGYMWFGTQDGLNRYDGQTFKVFKKNSRDSCSLGSNTVTAIAQDTDGILWIGTSDGAYLYNPRTERFRRYNAETADGKNVSGLVRDIKLDRDGNIWMAVFNKGVFRATPSGQLTYFDLTSGSSPAPVWIRCIAFDTAGHVWIGTYHQGMYCLDTEQDRVTQFLIRPNSVTGQDNDVNDISPLDAENLLVGTTTGGVQIFNLRTRSFSPLLERDSRDRPLYVRHISRADNGDLWIGSESGLYIYHPQTRQYENLRHVNGDTFSITDNAVHSVYQDREGGMWLGTFFGGVNYYIEPYSLFEKYYPVTGSNSIKGKSISEFCEADDDHIWIGTEDAGLHRFDPETKRFTNGYLPATNVHALMQDGDRLWVGSFTEGLFVLDSKTERYKQYRSSSDRGSLINNNIYSIYKDYMNVIWVGTMMGLCRYDERTDGFVPVQDSLITAQVNDIVEDHRGVLWFATIGGGLYAYHRNTDTWKHYATPIPTNATSGKVTCLLLDKHNHLWVGTEGAGLFRYDRERDVFTDFYSEDSGLPNNVIYQLVVDLSGHIWGSTNNGLFKLDNKSRSITVYTHANGLLGDQFNYKSGLRSRGGKLYFGGIKGFVAFAPYTIWQNEVPPPVVINGIQLHNQELVGVRELEIPHNASIFSISFAALSYVSPQRNQYAYRLEGKDEEWIYTDYQPRVTYSNLPPGNYIFRVKASNSDGVWNDEGDHVTIRVLPPFYRTGWAYFIYLVLFVLLTYGVVRYFTDRTRARNKRMLQAIARRKEKELYDTKIDFFTNITHEIRTPLSLIKAPLEEIMKHTDPTDTHWENLSIMERNTNRLLKLVNELLDFRKAEAKGVAVHFVQTDLVFVIRETVSRFISSAKLNRIEIDMELPPGAVYVDLDVEIFSKVVSNLLHNALKHAYRCVSVSLVEHDGCVKVTVANDGKPIAQEAADKIFLPFFKLDEKTQGSGLGLAFSKSLAELHNGDLYLPQSASETCFVFELPIRQACHERVEDTIGTATADYPLQQIAEVDELLRLDVKRAILLVEDNVEFRQFVASQLQSDYHVLAADHGREAINILAETQVDIIICDIMMPVMDGITFCKCVKEDLKFSHIPVILLTAKTSLQSKIAGLKTGADEYIEKPYSIDYLRARIENLLEGRRKIREAYQRRPETAYETIAHSKADECFLNQLIKTIHARLDEVDLDVDKLAAALNMSRATFYRKVKQISELTPNDFIRLVRLKKAAELLREKDYRISEIAYLVGFNSASYFSKCFQKQFGVLPKDFERIGA
ncbi:hybrid sensor histidine kinase/response regulator transcription factor [Parapedobacter soli]|uniref:hybrid sensor histidine kinase/response regulator transcription factor n=1 Tax=Parapedobacter soli TaxID=416955 RepID=UPI0021C71A3E|nr:hybrid sensor histidine kinase/response regulator transcription factor [Parapedobacter soli]